MSHTPNGCGFGERRKDLCKIFESFNNNTLLSMLNNIQNFHKFLIQEYKDSNNTFTWGGKDHDILFIHCKHMLQNLNLLYKVLYNLVGTLASQEGLKYDGEKSLIKFEDKSTTTNEYNVPIPKNEGTTESLQENVEINFKVIGIADKQVTEAVDSLKMNNIDKGKTAIQLHAGYKTGSNKKSESNESSNSNFKESSLKPKGIGDKQVETNLEIYNAEDVAEDDTLHESFEEPETSLSSSSSNIEQGKTLEAAKTVENDGGQEIITVPQNKVCLPKRKRIGPGGPFACSSCEYKCKKKDALTRHERQIHLNPEDKIPCDKCSSTFVNENQLKSHLKNSHSEEAEARRKIHNLSNLFYLKRKAKAAGNPDIYNNKCLECGVVFENSEKFEKHKKIHPTLDTCEFCGKDFVLLEKHIQEVHKQREKLLEEKTKKKEEEEKSKVECKICHKKFKSVATHMAVVHANLIPQFCYCSICGKRLKTKELKRHQRVSHPEPSEASKGRAEFSCQICQEADPSLTFRFDSNPQLRTHYQKFHKEEAETRGLFKVKINRKRKKTVKIKVQTKSNNRNKKTEPIYEEESEEEKEEEEIIQKRHSKRKKFYM